MRFERRLESETEIQKQKAYYLKAISVFKNLNLLDRGSFGFAFGKEIQLEEMSFLIGSWYNDKTKDKTAFYSKLAALGYSKRDVIKVLLPNHLLKRPMLGC